MRLIVMDEDDRITLPAEVMNAFDIKEGDTLSFVIRETEGVAVSEVELVKVTED